MRWRPGLPGRNPCSRHPPGSTTHGMSLADECAGPSCPLVNSYRWKLSNTASVCAPARALWDQSSQTRQALCSSKSPSASLPTTPAAKTCPSPLTGSRVPTFPKLSWRAQRGNLPQTVIASAARQSRRGNERRSWNEIAIRQRRTSLLAMTNWVRVSHFGSLSEAGFTGFTGCTGLGATLPSDDLNPDNPSNPGNPASDIPPPESGYA